MARLIAPNGATVNVSSERAKALVEQGYKAVESKASAKKAAAKSDSK